MPKIFLSERLLLIVVEDTKVTPSLFPLFDVVNVNAAVEGLTKLSCSQCLLGGDHHS